jgi:Lrp/AsnC family leucine-responsive transcriptional regulator|tara:strand:+ start:275 stop:526 length:252 start_codon:yes stop_codon:yes gene_type:complete
VSLELDDFDNKIIQALTSNARLSVSDLSRHVTLFRNAVIPRMNKLEKLGVIKGYKVILEADILVLDTYLIARFTVFCSHRDKK